MNCYWVTVRTSARPKTMALLVGWEPDHTRELFSSWGSSNEQKPASAQSWRILRMGKRRDGRRRSYGPFSFPYIQESWQKIWILKYGSKICKLFLLFTIWFEFGEQGFDFQNCHTGMVCQIFVQLALNVFFDFRKCFLEAHNLSLGHRGLKYLP